MRLIKPKYVERFLLGAWTALGTVTVKESYRLYKSCNPIEEHIRNKRNKERFDRIMAQTNLRDELA